VQLTTRKTGLASPAYVDWTDLTIYDAGRAVGRICEDRHSQPELRWFWFITMLGTRHAGIKTEGRASTLEEAKRQFQENWSKFLVWAKLEEAS
jgi:hypothetical protein